LGGFILVTAAGTGLGKVSGATAQQEAQEKSVVAPVQKCLRIK
jgi:hypothetical protein